MRKIFLKILIISIIIFITSIITFMLPIPYVKEEEGAADNILALMFNKNDLLKKKDNERIIIVGGSGSLYNINCKNIQKEINIPVINKGLFAGFGIKFILEEILSNNINNGDKIIIIPEYVFLASKKWIYGCHESGLKWILIRNPIKSFKYFYYSNKSNDFIIKIIECIQDKNKNLYYLIKKALFLKLNKIYLGYGNYDYDKLMDENGDKLKIANKKKVNIIADDVNIFPEIPEQETIKILNDFNLSAQKKGAKVYLFFSCYPRSYAINKNKEQIENYYKILKIKLKFKILNDPYENLFDDEYFLNTVNHLNSKGQKQMTDKLIENIKKYIITK